MVYFKMFAVSMLVSLIGLYAVTAQAIGAQQIPSHAICAVAATQAEAARNIPVKLLQAIALTESGRWFQENKQLTSWPWTVTAEGEGKFYETRAEAIKAVRALQDRGITNIDVGCMQINLHYHGNNFSSLDEIFSPINNVAYAATYLKHLRFKEQSWVRAVKSYHSQTVKHRTRYQSKVYGYWRELRNNKWNVGLS